MRTVTLTLFVFVSSVGQLWAQENAPQAVPVQTQQNTDETMKPTNDAESQKRPTPPSFLVPIQPPHSTTKQPKSRDETQQGADEASESWVIDAHRVKITDTLLVAVTCLLVLATFALWWQTRNLVKSAERTAGRQLRAYIGVAKMQLVFREVEQNPGIKKGEPGWIWGDALLFAYKNYGLTPAFQVYIHVNWQSIPFPQGLPHDFDYKDRFVTLPQGSSFTFSFSIADPGQMNQTTIIIDDPIYFIEAKEKRAWKVYIYGHIDYTDIYKIRWRRDFCFLYEPWSAIDDPFVPHAEHNDEKQIDD